MSPTDSTLEHLKTKYNSVFQAIDGQEVSLTQVILQDGKMAISGAAHSQQGKDRVFRELDRVNPEWQNEVTCDLRSEADQPPSGHTGQAVVNTSQDFSTGH